MGVLFFLRMVASSVLLRSKSPAAPMVASSIHLIRLATDIIALVKEEGRETGGEREGRERGGQIRGRDIRVLELWKGTFAASASLVTYCFGDT